MHKLKYSISGNECSQPHVYMYVLYIVEYVSIVWVGYSEQNSNALQKIKTEADHHVTGSTITVSLE